MDFERGGGSLVLFTETSNNYKQLQKCSLHCLWDVPPPQTHTFFFFFLQLSKQHCFCLFQWMALWFRLFSHCKASVNWNSISDVTVKTPFPNRSCFSFFMSSQSIVWNLTTIWTKNKTYYSVYTVYWQFEGVCFKCTVSCRFSSSLV